MVLHVFFILHIYITRKRPLTIITLLRGLKQTYWWYLLPISHLAVHEGLHPSDLYTITFMFVMVVEYDKIVSKLYSALSQWEFGERKREEEGRREDTQHNL